MDYMNQPQGAPANGGQQDQGQAQQPGQAAQMDGGYQMPQVGQAQMDAQAGAQMSGGDQASQPQAGGYQATQPQAGGYYQYQPGVGFVQVQGPSTQQGMTADTTMGAQATMGTADASAQAGMFGQGTPEGTEPKFDQEKLGKMYSTVTDVMNGEADPTSLIGLFADNSGDFWKGALVGAAAVVLLNNEAVKGALAGVAGSVGAMFGEGDPEGEQVTVGGK